MDAAFMDAEPRRRGHDLSRMDPRHLDLLRELADRHSVTAVAEATHRTPSAVSQQLRTAQRELGGIPLVEPHGRGVRLTEAGRLLADGGRDLARTIAQVQARWDAYLGSASGTVRLAALPSAAAVLLPEVLSRLADTAVGLECTDVDIAESEYPGMVADHDVVVGHSFTGPVPAGAEHLVTAALLREPLDIAMRADHVLATKARVTARDVVLHEWYGVPLGYPFDDLRIAVETATGTPVRVVQRIRDNRLVEALVAAGDRVAVLPRYSTTPGAGIVLRPVHGMDAARWIVAILRPDRAERLAVRTVLDALRAVGREVVG
ncbi:DNA-binding transcriptional regulator, LysR family [Promicromonospora umidemergens]|uniref:LysR family transcriptional regulator n=1 Tax=Promicromonospora umidemergens TaxID=629679 RepID=A0ABP8WR63_9MICO|nr:LysR family transcriptional regulator [Promicromonospora umidemergens]MCP2283396.1 DNA-binding transcriptional regulator, LysR family [Promicromonospora umidemergens]